MMNKYYFRSYTLLRISLNTERSFITTIFTYLTDLSNNRMISEQNAREWNGRTMPFVDASIEQRIAERSSVEIRCQPFPDKCRVQRRLSRAFTYTRVSGDSYAISCRKQKPKPKYMCRGMAKT